jgi:hypothetical protein
MRPLDRLHTLSVEGRTGSSFGALFLLAAAGQWGPRRGWARVFVILVLGAAVVLLLYLVMRKMFFFDNGDDLKLDLVSFFVLTISFGVYFLLQGNLVHRLPRLREIRREKRHVGDLEAVRLAILSKINKMLEEKETQLKKQSSWQELDQLLWTYVLKKERGNTGYLHSILDRNLPSWEHVGQDTYYKVYFEDINNLKRRLKALKDVFIEEKNKIKALK